MVSFFFNVIFSVYTKIFNANLPFPEILQVKFSHVLIFLTQARLNNSGFQNGHKSTLVLGYQDT